MAFQNCFTENQQTIKELLWKRKLIQGSEKQQVIPYISPAEQLPSTRKVCKKLQILIKDSNEPKRGAPGDNKLHTCIHTYFIGPKRAFRNTALQAPSSKPFGDL